MQTLEIALDNYNKTAVQPGNMPLDPRGDPRFWDYVWTNFGDYSPAKNGVLSSYS